VPTDPYVYPDSSCLRNRLGIRDPAALARIEANQTAIILAQLARVRLVGRYDLAHLRAFHRRIFSDIYTWAGELRTVPIAKEQSLFALPEHIEPYLQRVFCELAGEGFLRERSHEQFVDRITHYHAELNAVHPFREGNGRTRRAFLAQLARDAGYHIAWVRLHADRNVEASRASLHGDNQLLREMLNELVEPAH
jgi:cell filamentation protein, protein adenylyltransferase